MQDFLTAKNGLNKVHHLKLLTVVLNYPNINNVGLIKKIII